MKTYKAIKRPYTEITNDNKIIIKEGIFIAQGIMADNHLAYTRLDIYGNEIKDEICAYIQIRSKGRLLMSRI